MDRDYSDHGHGNVIWVLGGGDPRWPHLRRLAGLATAQFYQGRDLAVTTDYRTAIAVILERHLRLVDRQLTEIFPVYRRHGPTWGRCW